MSQQTCSWEPFNSQFIHTMDFWFISNTSKPCFFHPAYPGTLSSSARNHYKLITSISMSLPVWLTRNRSWKQITLWLGILLTILMLSISSQNTEVNIHFLYLDIHLCCMIGFHLCHQSILIPHEEHQFCSWSDFWSQCYMFYYILTSCSIHSIHNWLCKKYFNTSNIKKHFILT